MSDPKRFLDGGGTDLEQMLLASGRAARPTARARWKTEAFVLLAGLGIVAKAKAASPVAAKSYAWMLSRYLGFGVVGAAAAWGAGHMLTRPSPSAQNAAIAVSANPPPAAAPRPSAAAEMVPPAPALLDLAVSDLSAPRSLESAGERARTPRASGTRTLSAAKALPVEPASGASIGSEVQELDSARAALADGQPKTAIAALDRYAQAFPKGVLQQEALRIRIEALVALGDRTTARSLTSRFETLYPHSPHAKRLHSLVNGP